MKTVDVQSLKKKKEKKIKIYFLLCTCCKWEIVGAVVLKRLLQFGGKWLAVQHISWVHTVLLHSWLDIAR